MVNFFKLQPPSFCGLNFTSRFAFVRSFVRFDFVASRAFLRRCCVAALFFRAESIIRRSFTLHEPDGGPCFVVGDRRARGLFISYTRGDNDSFQFSLFEALLTRYRTPARPPNERMAGEFAWKRQDVTAKTETGRWNPGVAVCCVEISLTLVARE